MASNAKFEIVQLAPEQVADRLTKLINDGTIHDRTLVVWDMDNTLIRAGSDYMKSGTIPIHPLFSSIIRTSQGNGVMHIALTNASPFCTDLIFERDSLRVSRIEPIKLPFDPENTKKGDRTDYPDYLKGPGIFEKPTTYEALRIEGLKHISIDFNDSKFENFSREFPSLQWTYTPEKSETKFLQKMLKQHGKIIRVFANKNTQQQHITLDIHLIGSELFSENQKRHFIQTDDRLREFLAIPIFSHGIIFCNFINLHTQSYFGYMKGNILNSFLKIYQEKTGQEFSNIVFIDDTFDCVKNVVEAMRQIHKSCIGINILTPIEN